MSRSRLAGEPGQKLSTKSVPLSELTFDEQNARRHGKQNLKAIKASLIEFGQATPLIVEKGTGRVLGGNGTLRAMRSLGWPDASVVEVDVHGTRATALAVALNRTGELAHWDDDQLYTLLRDQMSDFDLGAFGWEDKDLKLALGGKKMVIPDEDDGDEEGETAGDGLRYRIVVDCTDEQHQADVLARMEAEGLSCQPLIS